MFHNASRRCGGCTRNRISKRKKECLPLRLTTISEDLLFSQSNQPLRYLNLYNQVGYRNSYYPITSFLFILVTSENYPSSVISIYIRSQLSRLALRTSAFNPVAARFPPNHVTNGPPTVPVSSRNYYPFARSKHRFEHVPQLIFQNA